MKDYLTTEQAAELLGVSRVEMLRKLRLGIIPAKRHGRAYLIDPRDVEKFKKHPRKRGNPDAKNLWKLSPRQGNPTLYKASPNWRKAHEDDNTKPRRKES